MKAEFGYIMRIVLVVALAIIVWIAGVMVGQENTVTIMDSNFLFGSSVRSNNASISLMLDYNNGTIDTYRLLIDDARNVWEILKKISIENNISLVYNQDEITGDLQWQALADLTNNDSYTKWHIWLNNQYQISSPEQIEIKDGDVISLKYLTFQP